MEGHCRAPQGSRNCAGRTRISPTVWARSRSTWTRSPRPPEATSIWRPSRPRLRPEDRRTSADSPHREQRHWPAPCAPHRSREAVRTGKRAFPTNALTAARPVPCRLETDRSRAPSPPKLASCRRSHTRSGRAPTHRHRPRNRRPTSICAETNPRPFPLRLRHAEIHPRP